MYTDCVSFLFMGELKSHRQIQPFRLRTAYLLKGGKGPNEEGKSGEQGWAWPGREDHRQETQELAEW